jgi:Sortase domain
VSHARLELHHEPPLLADRPAPTRVRIPGFALRVRVPGPRLQRRIAAAALAIGLFVTGVTTAGLVATRHVRTVSYPGPARVTAPRGPVAAPPSVLADAQRVSPPVYLTVPVIGVRTRLVHLGLTSAGSLRAPDSTAVAGWYTGSPPPGAIGAAVIGGHVDSYLGPGVFFRLRLLHAGDRIYVRQADGRLVVFRVSSVHLYAKDHFPTAKVYGPVPGPELRLITCGGTFDPARGSYLSNVVVDATLIP